MADGGAVAMRAGWQKDLAAAEDAIGQAEVSLTRLRVVRDRQALEGSIGGELAAALDDAKSLLVRLHEWRAALLPKLA